ncbi:hypothetical protein CHS0354_035098 [Potamilus streckersoni]|uniref:Uncharacterized protein n=1 Tax=Potamilus streckersoni TaxID=2493646 RepID=A0AAE0VWA1_9BIVA|nr:hypothetical protein CHS0354_035098 [Potamilus streckersoni]
MATYTIITFGDSPSFDIDKKLSDSGMFAVTDIVDGRRPLATNDQMGGARAALPKNVSHRCGIQKCKGTAHYKGARHMPTLVELSKEIDSQQMTMHQVATTSHHKPSNMGNRHCYSHCMS